jgi:hypothetical protein
VSGAIALLTQTIDSEEAHEWQWYGHGRPATPAELYRRFGWLAPFALAFTPFGLLAWHERRRRRRIGALSEAGPNSQNNDRSESQMQRTDMLPVIGAGFHLRRR